MPNTLRHKRSTAPSGIPTTAALSLGELAINTYDGKLFLKKNVSGSETVVEVGAITSGGVTAALGYTPANKAGESFTGAISVAGSITATGDVTAYSDASLKTDVATIAGALDLIRRMRGVRYQRLDCQTAFKTDPRSASNIDPSSLCSRTGGEARSGQLAQRVAA